MQRELADLIRREVKDPRVGMVTISAVEVSRDFEHAKVFISLLGDDAQTAQALEGLNNAAGFLRRELARRMLLRIIPKLRFVQDRSIAEGSRLSALIDKAVEEDRTHEAGDDEPSGDPAARSE
jgi:ribosome-binding factor A